MSDLSALVSYSLRTLLSETMLNAPKHGGFILNAGEPGFVETMKGLSAEVASKSPGPNRKATVAHANHVLFGWELIVRSLAGEDAFAGADWNAAWKLVQVNDAEWAALVARLEQTAQQIRDTAPQHQFKEEIMLTGHFATAAHTAYHLGAIRQIMLELQVSPLPS